MYYRFLIVIVIALLFDRGDVTKEKIEPYNKPLRFFGGPWVPGSRGWKKRKRKEKYIGVF